MSAPTPSTAHATSAFDAAALAEALRPLWASRYVFRLRPRAALDFPTADRGVTLRGALGLLLRRRVCHDLTLDCRACSRRPDCAYPDLFVAMPPPDSQRLRRLTDVPRPFAFDPPDDPRTRFGPDDRLEFGLVLIGRANRRREELEAAFRDLAHAGLGPRRVPCDVVAVEPAANDGTPQPDGSPAPRLRAADLLRAGDPARTAVILRFTTPLELRDAGAPVARPDFGALIRRLRDRAAALAAFFGDAPLDLDFRGLGDRADSVRLAADQTRRVHVPRVSGRTGRHHDLGGLVGEARYEGDAIGPLMPLLRLGELIHVGRHAAFGNGQFRVLTPGA